MKIGVFEIREPLPEFRELHAISMLRPWVDVGSVGTQALKRVEQHLGAQELGRLSRPGSFFDFTRYRPNTHTVEGQRRLVIPNTIINYAHREEGCDFLFLHLLEPHAFAEEYVESVIELFKTLKVTRHCRVGGMYDMVPHTRPLLVGGTLKGQPLTDVPGVISQRGRGYQGPTSIMNLMNQALEELNIESMSLMVRLPQYVELEEDFTGAARLLEPLCSVYGLPPHLAEPEKGELQYDEISTQVQRSTRMKAMVERLEAEYDARQDASSEEPPTPLSPEIEQFLRQMGQQLGDS